MRVWPKKYWTLVGTISLISVFNAWGDLGCRETYELLAQHLYGKIDRIEISLKPVSDPTPKEKAALEELLQNGGKGRIVTKTEIIYQPGRKPIKGPSQRYIEIQSPPQSDIYGKNFNAIFSQLRANRVPVLYDMEMKWADGKVEVVAAFHARSKGSFTFKPHVSANEVNAHEFQHVLDGLIDPDAFLSSAPKLPEGFDEILQKLRAGKKISSEETSKIDHVFGRLFGLLEARANKNEIIRTLTTGDSAFIQDKRVMKNLFRLFQASVDLNVAELQMIYHGLWINPLDPNHIYMAVKVGVSSYMIYEMTQLPLKIVGYGLVSLAKEIESRRSPSIGTK